MGQDTRPEYEQQMTNVYWIQHGIHNCTIEEVSCAKYPKITA